MVSLDPIVKLGRSVRFVCNVNVVDESFVSEPTKDNITSRIASTMQSASLHGSTLTKDEQHTLKRLKNDEDIVILPADKGGVTVVMDKTDYHDKMDALVK